MRQFASFLLQLGNKQAIIASLLMAIIVTASGAFVVENQRASERETNKLEEETQGSPTPLVSSSSKKSRREAFEGEKSLELVSLPTQKDKENIAEGDPGTQPTLHPTPVASGSTPQEENPGSPVPPSPTPVNPTPTVKELAPTTTTVPTPTTTPTPTITPTPTPVTTKVSGVVSSDTTWTVADSPYEITSTVQIPAGVTLTIAPGVSVIKPSSGDMFLLNGTLVARGGSGESISFDGGGNSNFFNPKSSSASTFLDLEWVVIQNGRSFWPASGFIQNGYFHVRNSQFINIANYSYVWYPGDDVHIENNDFFNAAGFSIGIDGSRKVYVRYNYFYDRNSALPGWQDYWVENWASYGSSETVVKYNTFANVGKVAVKLPSGYESASLSARENYWGTTDVSVIAQMISDQNDDITAPGIIDYEPILNSSVADTPSQTP